MNYYSITDKRRQDDSVEGKGTNCHLYRCACFRSNRATQNRENVTQIRETFTGIVLYNSGMQLKQRFSTEYRKKDLKEAWIVLCSFLCALLLSRVCIRGQHVPLALGLLLGCTLAGIETYGVLGGIVLGALIGSPPLWQTILAAVLFTASTRTVIWLKKQCKPRFLIILFCLSCVVSLPLLLLHGVETLLYGAASLPVSAAFGICVQRIIRSLKNNRIERVWTDTEQIMLILFLSAIILAASEAQLFGWSLSVSLLLMMSALYVSLRGVFGASAGTFCASLLVLYTGADPALIGTVALGALLNTALRKYGKPLIISAFFLSALLFRTILQEDALTVNLQNLLCSMLLYLLIPRTWMDRLRDMLDADGIVERSMRSTIDRIEQGASDELIRLGTLLSGFSGMFHTALQEDDAIRRWTVQGALAICQSCDKRTSCWKEAEAMQDAVLKLAKEADRDQSPKPIEPMDACCKRFRNLTASALLSYQQAKSREAVCERAKEQTGLVDRQFTGTGDALIGYAKRMRGRDRAANALRTRIRDVLTEAGAAVTAVDRYETNGTEVLSICMQRPLRMKKGELCRTLERVCGYPLRMVQRTCDPQAVTYVYERDASLHASMRVFQAHESLSVSGDATGECRLTGGHVCFALSDGMGSGVQARQESEAAIDLLFRLYHAGMRSELIYDNVNRLLLARNDTEMYATLDAVSIDLNSGEAELLKYGAPPSYLIRNGRVKTICGEALPCGILVEAKPSVIRMKLKPNDRLVLCSDGVQDMLSEKPEQAIRSVAGANEAMGELLLKIAQNRGGSDDMTVMVIRVA